MKLFRPVESEYLNSRGLDVSFKLFQEVGHPFIWEHVRLESMLLFSFFCLFLFISIHSLGFIYLTNLFFIGLFPFPWLRRLVFIILFIVSANSAKHWTETATSTMAMNLLFIFAFAVSTLKKLLMLHLQHVNVLLLFVNEVLVRMWFYIWQSCPLVTHLIICNNNFIINLQWQHSSVTLETTFILRILQFSFSTVSSWLSR